MQTEPETHRMCDSCRHDLEALIEQREHFLAIEIAAAVAGHKVNQLLDDALAQAAECIG